MQELDIKSLLSRKRRSSQLAGVRHCPLRSEAIDRAYCLRELLRHPFWEFIYLPQSLQGSFDFCDGSKEHDHQPMSAEHEPEIYYRLLERTERAGIAQNELRESLLPI